MDCSLQVGDMGIGFPDKTEFSKDGVSWFPEVDLSHRFFNGNHDHPEICKTHSNYLGNWGFLKEPSIFYVSGGYSIDQERRVKDVSWWEDEEISPVENSSVMLSYINSKPRIVVSHECPLILKEEVVTNEWKLRHDSRTEMFLQSLFDIHKPDYWIFGHHHRFFEKDLDKTHFVCLNELIDGKISDCIYEIEGLTWKGQKDAVYNKRTKKETV